MGEHIGEITRIDGKRLTVKLNYGITLHNGDGLCFLDDNMELQGFNVNGFDGNTLLSSSLLSFRAQRRDTPRVSAASEGIALYRNFDIIWQKSVDASSGNRKLPIKLEFSETSEGFKLSSENVSISLQCPKDIAKNPEKALENIRTKLSQWGDTKFTVSDIEIKFNDVYFIPASVLGEMKRQLVAELENTLVENHRAARPVRTRRACPSQSNYPQSDLSYLGNVTNSLSRKFYENHGVMHIDDGLERTMPEGETVVMTTKHCIRYANGLCSKEIGKPATSLYLSNERGRFRLDFDCKNCCMKVVSI